MEYRLQNCHHHPCLRQKTEEVTNPRVFFSLSVPVIVLVPDMSFPEQKAQKGDCTSPTAVSVHSPLKGVSVNSKGQLLLLAASQRDCRLNHPPDMQTLKSVFIFTSRKRFC